MSKKFTEEQYREIIRTYENNYGYDNKATAVIRVVDTFNDGLSYNEALALANPLTQEWAHEQFVDKEKKYVWRLNADSDMIVSKTPDGYWYLDRFPALNKEFTRIDIENSPFKPEWFEKEEVQD